MKMSQKILAVDDDNDILDALKHVLYYGGYEVVTLLNAENIFEEVEMYKPNLILLDVTLSGKDGRQVCKQLKTNTTTKEIPVIMISATPGLPKDILSCGAEDFIAKPFDINDLLHRIGQKI